MAVKRLTIELDDVPDSDRRTSVPSMLLAKEDRLPVRRSKTMIPSEQPDYQEPQVGSVSETQGVKEVVGRTPADLVWAFVNRAEFMATVFVFVSFLVSVGKLQSLSDLWIPFVIAFSLNAVWFGCLGIRKLVSARSANER